MKRSIFAFLMMLMIAPIAKAESKISTESNEPVLRHSMKENSFITSSIEETTDIEIIEAVEEAKIKMEGIVSWYADKFQGKRTSSGEVYNNKELTAAHRTLPFGSKVKVTNVKNGKSVIVKINDRGPHTQSRVMDLSKAAFSQIGSTNSGVLNIEMEVVK